RGDGLAVNCAEVESTAAAAVHPGLRAEVNDKADNRQCDDYRPEPRLMLANRSKHNPSPSRNVHRSRLRGQGSNAKNATLQPPGGLSRCRPMLKKFLTASLLPLLVCASGCTALMTNLTPQVQERNPNNLYPVEVALQSRQQTLRWESIKPQIVVGTEFYPMRPTLLMTNRWEG